MTGFVLEMISHTSFVFTISNFCQSPPDILDRSRSERPVFFTNSTRNITKSSEICIKPGHSGSKSEGKALMDLCNLRIDFESILKAYFNFLDLIFPKDLS